MNATARKAHLQRLRVSATDDVRVRGPRAALLQFGRDLARHPETAHVAAAFAGLAQEADHHDAQDAVSLVGQLTDASAFSPSALALAMPKMSAPAALVTADAKRPAGAPLPNSIQVHKGEALAPACARVQPGWSLELERGGRWTESLAIGAGRLIGTPTAPVYIRAFGQGESPVIAPVMQHGLETYGPANAIISGINLCPQYDGSPNTVTACTVGKNFWAAGEPCPTNLTFENCLFGGALIGLVLNNARGTTRMRGCRFLDNNQIGTSPHAQGLYMGDHAGQVFLDHCVFDNNGRANPTIYRHPFYFQYDGTADFFLDSCLVSRNGADGGQLRARLSSIRQSVFMLNPMGPIIGSGGSCSDSAFWRSINIVDGDPSMSRAHGPQFTGGAQGNTFEAARLLLCDERTDNPVNRAGVGFSGTTIAASVHDCVSDGWLNPLDSASIPSNLLTAVRNRWDAKVLTGLTRPTIAQFVTGRGGTVNGSRGELAGELAFLDGARAMAAGYSTPELLAFLRPFWGMAQLT